MNQSNDPKSWEPVHLTCKGLEYLQEEHGINMLIKKEAQLDSPKKLAAIFYAATRHWSNPPSFEEVYEKYSLKDMAQAIKGIMNEAKTSADEQKKTIPSPT